MIRQTRVLPRVRARAGNGNFSSASGLLTNAPCSFRTRFEDEKGTNPERLHTAARAGCFTMALAFRLRAAGYTATEFNTEGIVTLGRENEGLRTGRSTLTLRADLNQGTFARVARDAEPNCPLSWVLRAEITPDAKIV
jgi:osmotically inducible protein OsmC